MRLLDQLGRLGLAAAHLEIQIFFADPLSFEGRAVGQRDVHLGHRDLEAPDFDGFLGHLVMGTLPTTCS